MNLNMNFGEMYVENIVVFMNQNGEETLENIVLLY